MEEGFLAGLNIRPMTVGDLDAIVEIDCKVLGKPRPDYWKKKIELPNPDILFPVWSLNWKG